jgi:hypothetical protein
MAQYRLGRDREALQTLTRADPPKAPKFGGAGPVDLALLALVHHRLGLKDEARELMDRLRQRTQGGPGKQDEELGMLLDEAELRIHGTVPPWVGGEGAPPAPMEKATP